MKQQVAEVREEQEEDEAVEFVLFDLQEVSNYYSIPPNAPFVLSGLDTINPILVIDNKVKLIGEYEETMGTCLVFSKTGSSSTSHVKEGSSGGKFPSSVQRTDPKQAPEQQAMPMACANRVLRFKLLAEDDRK